MPYEGLILHALVCLGFPRTFGLTDPGNCATVEQPFDRSLAESSLHWSLNQGKTMDLVEKMGSLAEDARFDVCTPGDGTGWREDDTRAGWRR
ncbi:MAG: hypothetical protein CEE40_01695 [Chloroflexi bacterium B3_Chlor]|nr:MAG: hypothetical protein CEE40_01695 [Chloroflexi bacterium B3_Chlor]